MCRGEIPLPLENGSAVEDPVRRVDGMTIGIVDIDKVRDEDIIADAHRGLGPNPGTMAKVAVRTDLDFTTVPEGEQFTAQMSMRSHPNRTIGFPAMKKDGAVMDDRGGIEHHPLGNLTFLLLFSDPFALLRVCLDEAEPSFHEALENLVDEGTHVRSSVHLLAFQDLPHLREKRLIEGYARGNPNLRAPCGKPLRGIARPGFSVGAGAVETEILNETLRRIGHESFSAEHKPVEEDRPGTHLSLHVPEEHLRVRVGTVEIKTVVELRVGLEVRDEPVPLTEKLPPHLPRRPPTP